MAGAYEETDQPYPDRADPQAAIAECYRLHYVRLRNYFAARVGLEAAHDLVQLVFVKALESKDTYKGHALPFTWLFAIAQNTLKNEYRTLSRRAKQVSSDEMDHPRFLAIDFTKHIEIRLDLGTALKQLGSLDQTIIALRFFADCSLKEMAVIVNMKESAVKNRLYRALGKLRNSLKEWGTSGMSLEELFSIINHQEPGASVTENAQVYTDLMQELKNNVDLVSTCLDHSPSGKIVIEIYPNLQQFHQAVNETDAPDWFMGTYRGNTLKIVSPLNPGPSHTYQSILKSTIHLFAMWMVTDMNNQAPRWILQGIGGYTSKQMGDANVINSIRESVLQGNVPEWEALNDDSWAFGTRMGFQYSYKAVEFLVQRNGWERLRELIRHPDGLENIYNCTRAQLHDEWKQFLRGQAAG